MWPVLAKRADISAILFQVFGGKLYRARVYAPGWVDT